MIKAFDISTWFLAYLVNSLLTPLMNTLYLFGSLSLYSFVIKLMYWCELKWATHLLCAFAWKKRAKMNQPTIYQCRQQQQNGNLPDEPLTTGHTRWCTVVSCLRNHDFTTIATGYKLFLLLVNNERLLFLSFTYKHLHNYATVNLLHFSRPIPKFSNKMKLEKFSHVFLITRPFARVELVSSQGKISRHSFVPQNSGNR